MKNKILILGLLFMVFVGFVSFTTKAVENDPSDTISYSSITLYSTYMALQIDIPVPENVYQVNFYLPYSQYHVIEVGGVDAYIDISQNVTSLYAEDVLVFKGSQTYGWYYFDLEALDALGADEITLVITQTYTATPSGYVAYIQDNDQLSYVYNRPFDIEVSFTNEIVYSTYQQIVAKVNAPYDMTSVSFYYAESAYHEYEFGGIESTINFYDESDNNLFGESLKDVNVINNLIYLDIRPYLDTYTLEIGDVAYIKVAIVQNYTIVPSQYIEYMNDNSSVTFNDNLRLAVFVNDGVEEDTELFYTSPTFYTPVKIGFTFDKWYLANGQPFNFDIVTNDMLINNTLYLYAQYKTSTSGDVTPPAETPNSIIAGVFATVGLDTTIGYILVYIVVLIATVFALWKFNLSPLIIAVGITIITAIFIYLGILPFIVSLIALGMSATTIFFSLKGSE